MVASEPANLSNFHMPSRLRPRHRQNSPHSVTNYGVQPGTLTDIEAVDRKTSRYYRHESANAADSMSKTLRIARYLVLFLLFMLVTSPGENATNGETIIGTVEEKGAKRATTTATAIRSSATSTRPIEIESRKTVRPTSKPIQNPPPAKPGTRREHLLKLAMETGLEISRNATKPSRRIKPNPSIKIPENIDFFLQDVSAPRMQKDAVPFFWHILKSGGTTTKDAIGMCLNKVEASESGVLQGHHSDLTLQKVHIANSKIEYANVDTTTPQGISRAVSMGLVESDMADVIFSPLLHESTRLFDNASGRKGRAFCLFRHPLERAVSLFHYLKQASWEPTFSERLHAIQTVEDYAVSEFAENNWMTRFLTNEMSGPLNRAHLDTAKEILRRKVFVGLTLDMETSFERFMTFFGWNRQGLNTEQRNCLKKYLFNGSNRNKHLVEEDTIGWKLLKGNNVFDLELYDYVLQLYEEQGEFLESQA